MKECKRTVIFQLFSFPFNLFSSFLGSNSLVGPLIDHYSYIFNARPAVDNVLRLRLTGFTKANTT